MRVLSVVYGASAALLLAGCWSGAASSTARRGPELTEDVHPDESHRERKPSGAIIFDQAQLDEANIPLLDLMRRRVAGLQVQSSTLCPEVVLRGRSTVQTSSSPAIYVEGMQASNTCILLEMNTSDMSRVEIYPNGVPARRGYKTHPYGVILIFVRGASDT